MKFSCISPLDYTEHTKSMALINMMFAVHHPLAKVYWNINESTTLFNYFYQLFIDLWLHSPISDKIELVGQSREDLFFTNICHIRLNKHYWILNRSFNPFQKWYMWCDGKNLSFLHKTAIYHSECDTGIPRDHKPSEILCVKPLRSMMQF